MLKSYAFKNDPLIVLLLKGNISEFESQLRVEMLSRSIDSLSLNEERRINIGIFAVLTIEHSKALIDTLSALNLARLLNRNVSISFETCFFKVIASDNSNYADLIKPPTSHFNLFKSQIQGSEINKQLESINNIDKFYKNNNNEIRISFNNESEINILNAIYLRNKLNNKLTDDPCIIIIDLFKRLQCDTYWMDVYKIGILNEDSYFLDAIYNANEYFLANNSQLLFSISLEYNLWISIGWIHSKGFYVGLDENVFNLLESSTTRSVGLSKILSDPLKNIVCQIRNKSDATVLMLILRKNPLDLIEQAEDDFVVDILMDF